MYITIEVVGVAKELGRSDKLLHGVIRALDDCTREEKALDVVTDVKVHSELGDLFRRERGAGHVVRSAVDAVLAVIDANVGKEDFKKRYAAAVLRPAVTDAAGRSVTNAARVFA